ncbi:helix-turn-helix domain-containing protein [Streptomyces sp. MBT65]|uniref:helix-turn-helix domain-containing protein n=1 Tax=Streptomyces sp. MBT65 TaxID=1488395 RepID=UPI00190CE09C|nr:helix-turn-helix domain-containing protein [Streptomyces sp. MBT65]MBK3574835.1 helix-turn-helix domain-containing protein [Streptomyces sp. MBT65]
MIDTVRIPRAHRFATAQIETDRQVELWERHNAKSLIALACRPPAARSFEATEVNLQLERIHLARVRGTRHLVERSAELVEAEPTEAIAVYVTIMGETVFEQDGQRRVLRPGQLLVCDADRPFLRAFGQGLDELAVKVPRSEFSAITGLATVPTPVTVDVGPGQNQHGRALARLVGRAVRRDCPVPADEQAVLELVSVLATRGQVGLPVAHTSAARMYIEEHFTDPMLRAADIASSTGISERHLSRLFAAVGTSVPRHILARRLDAAYSMLSADTTDSLRTSDVAARCGFTSVAYFSHTFHKRFGITAGDVRPTPAD